jgi:plastocyanin
VVIIFIAGKSKKIEAPSIMVSEEESTLVEDESTSTITDVAQEVKEFVITGKNFSFDPAIISVKKGDKVKIVFKNTQGFHDFVVRCCY